MALVLPLQLCHSVSPSSVVSLRKRLNIVAAYVNEFLVKENVELDRKSRPLPVGPVLVRLMSFTEVRKVLLPPTIWIAISY